MSKYTQRVSNLPFEFSNKLVTPWGGLRYVQEFMEHCGFRQKLRELEFHKPGSGAGANHFEYVESFLVSVILGAKRCSDAELLRLDEPIRVMFGWKKGMPDQSTLSRFFRKYDRHHSTDIFTELNKWWFSTIQKGYLTVDFDSTVITRYGEQEGVAVGYNPKKQGRGSHHPILAFVNELNMVAHATLRPGNAVSKSDFEPFLEQTIDIIGVDKIALARLDSGFYSNDVMTQFESKEIPYIIAAKFTSALVTRVIEKARWIKAKDGVEYRSIMYQAQGWKAARRIVVVRKNSELLANATGKTLFPEMDDYQKYRYSAYVTTAAISDDLVWEVYKHRAEAENQIKELKMEYGLDGFCFKDMAATEFAFRWVTVAYNLMNLFRITAYNSDVKHILKTMKFNCIAIGAYLVRHSRRTVLKMCVHEKRRSFFDQIFQRIIVYENPKVVTCEIAHLPIA